MVHITKNYIKLNYLKFIAILMCWLIISLPVYASSAYAISIENIKVTGADGKEGYVKTMDDTLNIEATISEAIKPTEIFVDISSLGVVNDVFNSCNEKVCTYSHAISSIDSKQHSLTVNVNTESGDSDSNDQKFCADGLGPSVKVTAAGQDKGKLVVKFTATDKAPSGCAGLGITDVMLFLNGEQFKAMDPPFSGDKSTEEYTFVIDKSELSEEILNGPIDACVEATDVLGNSGKGCKTTTSKFDFTAPDILEETIVVTDENDNVLKYVAGAKEDDVDVFTKINVKVNISEENLKTSATSSATYADFSALTTKSEKKTQYEKKAPDSCTKEDQLNNIYVCVWKGIEYNGKIEVLNVKFHAEDTAGNKDDVEATLPVTKYSGNPVVGRIFIVGKEDQEPVYLAGGSSGNNGYDIGVEISDPVGFNVKKNLKLNLDGFTTNYASLTNDCEETSAGVWLCKFNVQTKPKYDGDGLIEVATASENDLNKLIDVLNSVEPLKVVVDSTIPSLVKINEESDKVEDQIITSVDCPTSDDELELTFQVTDKNKVNTLAYYEKDNYLSTSDVVPGTCIEGEETFQWECSITITNIIPIPSKKVPIFINVTDASGNTLKIDSLKTDICESETEKAPDFIKSITIDETNYNLPSIDKRTLSQRDLPIILSLKYEFYNNGNKKVKILSQTLDCPLLSSTKFIDGTDMVIAGTNNDLKDVFFLLKQNTLSKDDPNIEWDPETGEDINTLFVECTNTMQIQLGLKIFQQVESEKFTIELPLYNLALGEASDSIEDTLSQIEKDISSLGDSAESWELAASILGFLCTIAETLGVINGIVQGIKSVIWGILVAFSWWSGAEGVWKSVCGIFDWFHGTINQYVWPVNTVPPPFYIGHIFKYICLYAQCKFADPTFWGDVAGEYYSMSLNKDVANKYGQNNQKAFAEYDGLEYTDKLPPASTASAAPAPTPASMVQDGGVVQVGEDAVKAPTNMYPEQIEPSSYSTSEDPPKGGYTYKGITKHKLDSTEALKMSPPNYATGKKFLNTVYKLGSSMGDDELKSDDFKEPPGLEPDWFSWDREDYTESPGTYSGIAFNPETYDPFRMEAMSYFCPVARAYNLEKEKQLKCIERSCINAAIDSGQPITTCTKLHKAQDCLYIESATAKIMGNAFIQNFIITIIFQVLWGVLLAYAVNLIYTSTCYPYYTPMSNTFCLGPIQTEGAQSTLCGLGMSALALNELIYFYYDITEISDKYYESLNPDYC